MHGDGLLRTLAILAGAMSLVSCSDRPAARTGTEPKKGKPVVYTSAYPLRYFAERIAGETAEVRCITPLGEDAEYHELDAGAIRAAQEADLILVNGALLEKWLRKVFLPASRVVDTSKPLRGAYMLLKDTVTHSHGPEGAHTHEGVVAQTWLDPRQASVQAGEIARALLRLLPERTAAIEENLAGLQEDLDELDGAFAELFKDYDGRHFIFSHPVYGYFARRYELEATSLHVEPNEMPADEEFESVKRMLRAKPAKYVIWEFKPAGEIAERFRRELGLDSVTFETCTTYTAEHAAAGMDYLAIMRRNLANIRPVFGAKE